MDGDPQAAIDRRLCARHLLQHPLTCAENDTDLFRMIRRHETVLDRWFTQRLGYRLHIDADTARLFKIGTVPEHRPLRTKSERAFRPLEYTMLALVLASTAAGPAIISLRDLVAEVRSAAAEAEVALAGDMVERRALVAVLRWMIDHGLASEMFEHVDAYVADDEADAVLKVRPDRIALLPIAALIGADDPATLLERADRRTNTRQWMRCRLVEDPVLYREDLSDAEWGELRRRLGEEERTLHEMFGLMVEARAEGVAAVDPSGTLADRRFPTGGTISHAALLLIERLAKDTHEDPFDIEREVSFTEVVEHITELAELNARRWSKDLVAAPDRLARDVTGLLVDLRLATVGNPMGSDSADAAAEADPDEDRPVVQPANRHDTGDRLFRLRPAAARFVAIETASLDDSDVDSEQAALW